MLAMRIRVLAVTLLLVAGCAGDGSRSLPQGDEPANLDADDFVERIDHPFWPMSPGNKWVYREDGQRVEVTVTERTKQILGIDATVVHDAVSEDGELVEDTFDWYAQDEDGNLWYLGEETKEFENGEVKSTAGSWEAGVDGAEAGILLPGEPEAGQRYRQEYYEGEAEDNGEILSVDEKVEVPFGSFDEVLMTKDTTPLEPDVLEHKFYARDVGPVLVLKLSGDSGREELVRFTRGS
jgi:hypothetical protein